MGIPIISDTLATRGERLELLVNKTENLSASVIKKKQRKFK
jgi:hypothetical protein